MTTSNTSNTSNTHSTHSSHENTIFSAFQEEVRRGLLGLNKGIPTGIEKLDKVLNGFDRGIYYTLFSEGGTGKSSLAWVLALNMIDHCLKYKLKIKVFMFSMEVIATRVISKMLCYKIFKERGILFDPDYLMSRGDNKPNAKSIELIQEYQEYFNMLETSGILEIYDTPCSPEDIRIKIDNYAAAHGTIKPSYAGSGNGKTTYKSKDNEYVLIITDTVGNLSTNGRSVKQTIDQHSANCRSVYRDTYNFIPFNISHANRAITDPIRAKLGEVFPILSDIKETNMLEQDSSVVMCLFNPFKHLSTFKQLDKFMNYDINVLRNRFRCIGVLKNRHGEDNKRIGLSYHGECGSFTSLPTGLEMTDADYKKVIEVYKNSYK